MTINEYEFKVNIGGTDYGMDKLTSAHITQPLFDKFDVGLACSACLVLTYYFDLEPAKASKVVAYCRPRYSTDDSAWKQLGVFYVDSRTSKSGLKTLTCYDSMMRSDATFLKDGDVGEWPRNMKQLVYDLAAFMDVELDERTIPQLNATYTYDYPNDDTGRTILQYVAAAHCGNWIITSQDKLLLVPLFSSMPPETYYLVTQDGEPITFGDTRILIE
jgi:hypothetical protein